MGCGHPEGAWERCLLKPVPSPLPSASAAPSAHLAHHFSVDSSQATPKGPKVLKKLETIPLPQAAFEE